MDPIETEYKGYRFRSRLEARWAVFLDSLGATWTYEPQGFQFENGERYLPDFQVDSFDCWIEVKGPEPSDRDRELCYLLAKGSGSPVILAQGQFEIDESPPATLSPSCQIFWGPIEQAFDLVFDYHESDTHHPISVEQVHSPPVAMISLAQHLRSNGYDAVYKHTSERVRELIEMDRNYWKEEYGEERGKEHPRWKHGWTDPVWGHQSVSIIDFSVQDDWRSLRLRGGPAVSVRNENLRESYLNAQQARFEYGTTPNTTTGHDFSEPAF